MRPRVLQNAMIDPGQVKFLYQKLDFTPDDPSQAYKDAWSVKRLYGYARRREKDAARRKQTPRAPRLEHSESSIPSGFWPLICFIYIY